LVGGAAATIVYAMHHEDAARRPPPAATPAREAPRDDGEDATPTLDTDTILVGVRASGWSVSHADVSKMDDVIQTTVLALKKNMAANLTFYECKSTALAREILRQTNPPSEAVQFGATVVRISPGPSSKRSGVASLTGSLFTFKSVAMEQGEDAARQAVHHEDP